MLSRRFLDFWLLGGASILVWLILLFGDLFRHDYGFVGQRYESLAAAFAVFTLICNHPHFMASYRMAYSRNRKFYFDHWLSLIALPVLFIGFFAYAYVQRDSSLAGEAAPLAVNGILEKIGIGYRIGEARNLGQELLGISVWVMYFTVGWHYAKQVFGCALVYANYDRFPIDLWQRRVLKCFVFSIAFYAFCHVNLHWRDSNFYAGNFQFLGMPVTEIGLPAKMEWVAQFILGASLLGFLYSIAIRNKQRTGKWPSLNFLVPILAFYIWWVPGFRQKEFYFLMVPFFHSLQYLPFAFRIEKETIAGRKKFEVAFTVRLLALLLAGFLAFDLVPGLLDFQFSSSVGSTPLFFTIAFAVFINVHHFFLDSVLWRFKDGPMKNAILSPQDSRRIPAEAV